MSKFIRYWALLAGMMVFVHAHASPDQDPLGQLIQSRQNPDQPDKEALDQLINSRISVPDPRINVVKPAPVRQSTVPTKITSDNRISNVPRKSNKSEADELLSSAMGFLGVAYRFGGTSPSGFDCSGFMQYIFRKAYAVNLPRTSAEQATVGVPVSRADLQAGDMVFFRTQGSRISHVGMYIGNNRFIHAPRTGKNIEISSLSSKYWDARYAMARRVKRNNAERFIR